MPDFQSRTTRIAAFRRGVASVPDALVDPAMVEKKGSLLNCLAAGASAVADEVESRSLAKLSALTIDGAEGAELDVVAVERTYGDVARLGATQSVIEVVFTRPSAAAGSGTIGAGMPFQGGGVTFTLDAPVSFGALEVGPKPQTATSSAAGSGTRVSAGAVTSAGQTLFDPALVVSQPVASSGGDDVEIDPQLRARIRAWSGSVRRGTLAALEAGARSVPGVRQAVAVDVVDSTGAATGLVIIYIADGNGQANAALVRKVANALRDYRVAGIIPRVVGSAPSWVSLAIAIGYRDGYDTPTVQDQARAAVVAAVNSLAPNEPLLVSLVLAALRAVPGAVVPATALVSPVGDLYPSAGATLRTRSDLVSFV